MGREIMAPQASGETAHASPDTTIDVVTADV
jgi:hypothetical protein